MGTVSLTAGQPVDILVEYTNTKPPVGSETDRSQPALMRGVVSILFSRRYLWAKGMTLSG